MMSRDRRSFENCPFLFSSAGDGFPGFLVSGSAPLRFALIPLLLSFRKRKFYFDPAVLEVHAGRNQRQPFLLGLPDQLPYFFFVNQQLTCS